MSDVIIIIIIIIIFFNIGLIVQFHNYVLYMYTLLTKLKGHLIPNILTPYLTRLYEM